MNNAHIAFVGAGHMAEAILAALIRNNYPAEQISCFDLREERLAELNERYGVQACNRLDDALRRARLVIAAVKPVDMPELCADIGTNIAQGDQKTLISIAAGISLDQIHRWLGRDIELIRVMPNLVIEVGMGFSALYAHSTCSAQSKRLAENIFSAASTVAWLDNEDDMHLVTSVSGSGPGFFFYLFEQMIDAAVELGINREMAKQMILSIAGGTANMGTRASLADLRRRVTSPGGTTAAGLKQLGDAKLTKLFEQVFQRAANRSRELSAESGKDS